MSEYYDGETIRTGYLTEKSDLGKHTVTVLDQLVKFIENYYFTNKEAIQNSVEDSMEAQASFYSSVSYSFVNSVLGSIIKNMTTDKSIRAKHIEEVIHTLRMFLEKRLLGDS